MLYKYVSKSLQLCVVNFVILDVKIAIKVIKRERVSVLISLISDTTRMRVKYTKLMINHTT